MAKAAVKPQSTSAKGLATKPAVKADGDVLTVVASEVESLTQKKAFELVDELVDSGGVNDFRLGGVLARIQSQSESEGGEEWLGGHASFKELIDEKFGLQYRKAMYLIDIYTNLVEKQIPWDSVSDVGWTKLKDLSRVLTVKNVDTWVAKAKKLTVMQLQEVIKKAENKGGDASEKETSAVTTLTFKLHPDQKDSIREALDKAKSETHTAVDTVALHNICQAYLGNAIEVEMKGNGEIKPKPKGKAKLIAYYNERATELFTEIKEDDTLDDIDDKVKAACNPLDEIWPDVKFNIETP
jgi:polyhydroxyalkanoate synthesis regulator phasin